MTNDPLQTLTKVIRSIQEQQGYPRLEIRPQSHLVQDLGFTSLDIAQLVAMMEGELGADPFAQGATLDQISTVGVTAGLYAQMTS